MDAGRGSDGGRAVDEVPRAVRPEGCARREAQRPNVSLHVSEEERAIGYWRDVGSIDSFFEAHQDLVSALPIFNLYNNDWPIFSQHLNSPPAKFVRDARNFVGTTIDSIVSPGSVLSGAHVERSVLGPWTNIESGAAVIDSIVFERSSIGANATVRKAILDKDVVVAAGASVGVDHDADRAKGFTVTDSGITIVGKGVHVTA